MIDRIDLHCPLCGETVNVGVVITPKLTHTMGNGRKGFLSADASVGGMEHTCPELRVS